MQRLVWGAGRQRALLRSCPPASGLSARSLLLILRYAEPPAVLLRHRSLSSGTHATSASGQGRWWGPRSEVLGGGFGEAGPGGHERRGPRRRPCLAPMQRETAAQSNVSYGAASSPTCL